MGHDTPRRWQELCPSASSHAALYRHVRRRKAYEYAIARKCTGLHSREVSTDGKPFGERVANGCVVCAALTTMVIFSQWMVRSRPRVVVAEDKSSLLRSRLPVKQKPGPENEWIASSTASALTTKDLGAENRSVFFTYGDKGPLIRSQIEYNSRHRHPAEPSWEWRRGIVDEVFRP
jgi:hypothetical protein